MFESIFLISIIRYKSLSDKSTLQGSSDQNTRHLGIRLKRGELDSRYKVNENKEKLVLDL